MGTNGCDRLERFRSSEVDHIFLRPSRSRSAARTRASCVLESSKIEAADMASQTKWLKPYKATVCNNNS